MTDDDNEGAKVIPIVRGPERERPPLAYKPPKLGSYCSHRHTEIDVVGRVLTCTDCGREIDPYEYLGSLLHEVDWNEAVRTKRQLCKEIDALTKERQRLRDAVNRLKRKGVP